MKKTFVLDANVLLHDPESIHSFEDNDMVIILSVLSEVDSFKKTLGEIGANARIIARELDELTKIGNLSQGVANKEGGMIFVYPHHRSTANDDLKNNVDSRLIAEAMYLRDQGRNAIVVSNDTVLRVMANSLGVPAEEYKTDVVKNEIDRGFTTLLCPDADLAIIRNNGKIDIDKFPPIQAIKFYPNYYLILQSQEDPKVSVLAKVDPSKRYVEILDKVKGGLRLTPKNAEQTFVLDALMDERIKMVSIIGSAGSGKAQPMDAKILTNNGYKNMENVKIGDYVFSHDGNLTKVLGVFPQGEKDIYEIIFSDGATTKCCLDHLWYTKDEKERDCKKDYSIKDTNAIKNSLKGHDGRKNHSIPLTCPVDFTKKCLSIDPYLLGVLIGDGCVRNSVSFSSIDTEIINSVNEILEIENMKTCKKGTSCDYEIVNKVRKYGLEREYISVNISNGERRVFNGTSDLENNGFRRKSLYPVIKTNLEYKGCKWRFGKKIHSNKLKENLKNLGVFGCLSYEKFIPSEYLYSNIEDRISLLQGLMDTDGTVDKRSNTACFTTTSEKLKDNFTFLVESLGGICRIGSRYSNYVYNGTKKQGRKSYNISINVPKEVVPFKLKRKLDLYKVNTKYIPTRYIEDIKYVGKEMAQCIYVENKNHTYLTNNCVVTHNTLLAVSVGHYFLTKTDRYYKMLVSRPMIPLGNKDVMGFLPGSADEKLDPWMQPIYDAFEVLVSTKKEIKDGREFVKSQKNIKIEPLAYIRGRSINDQYFLIDEAQGVTPLEVKTIITRAGENTKVVLTGDIDQIDNPYMGRMSNGLAVATEAFYESSLAAHIVLSKGVRSRLSEEAANRL
jgi:predicted ribonuclease YlaK